MAKNTTTLWSYDEQGNIINKTEYPYSKDELDAEDSVKSIDYKYFSDLTSDDEEFADYVNNTGWNKLLIGVDINGNGSFANNERIVYDSIGNPTSYLGANLEWFGRQLQKYTKGSTIVDYTYDADGLRTSKIVDGATTTYQYVGDKLYYLCAKDATGADDYEMYFFYDSYDKLTVLKYFKHKGENPGEYTYYVATNYFGDVVALYSGQGDLRVTYEYDAWGNIIAVRDADEAIITDSDSIAHRNPIRYRSYYYDTETGLYYLQSRYYNPEIGRFLNADGYVTTGQGLLSYNMFVYCLNNPVKLSDPTGKIVGLKVVCSVIVIALVTAIGVGLAIHSGYITPKVSSGIDDLAKETAKTAAVRNTARAGSIVISAVGTGISLYNTNKATKDKLKMIDKMTKDCYNSAYYARKGNSYTPESCDFNAFSDSQYKSICQNNIRIYDQEIALYSMTYPDLGTVDWDNLSDKTKAFMVGKFPDVDPSSYIHIEGYYTKNGAYIP